MSTQVRLVSESDPSTLYSLCRRWVRNDIPRADRVCAFVSLRKEINHCTIIAYESSLWFVV